MKKITDGKIKFLLAGLDKTLGYAVLIAVFILIFITAHKAIFDLDIWLHLKTGEIIFKEGSVPSKDIFSFTIQGKPWVNHEWLFQLFSYLIYAKWQADGLILLQSIIIVLCFLVLFFIGIRQVKSYTLVAMLILLTAFASSTRFNIRPDMLSLFFFSLYLYYLNFHIHKKVIYFLLPLQVLWVNIHGYFFLGPLLILLFILSEYLRRNLKTLPWQWREQFALSDIAYRRLKYIFFLSLLVCLINPNFIKGALYPLAVSKDILLGHSKVFFENIQELKFTFTASKYMTYSVFYYAVLAFCFLSMLLNFKILRLIDLFLFTLFFLFSFRIRNIAFSSFINYTIIIYYAGGLLLKITNLVNVEVPKKKLVLPILRYGANILFLIYIAAKINNTLYSNYYDFSGHQFKSRLLGIIEQDNYPKKAADFLLENGISGNILNEFNSGAYLIGRAYPKIRVFIDGRTELYGQGPFRQYQQAYEGKIDVFERLIKKYNIGVFFVNLTRKAKPEIIKYVYKNNQWKLVFFDEDGMVFLKDIPSNQALIERYKIDFNKYAAPRMDFNILGLKRIYPLPYIKRARIFDFLGEEDLVIQESQEALRIKPDCGEAYNLLGKVYLRKNLYPQALENLRAALLFLPNDTEMLTDLGVCLKELKEAKRAQEIFEKAIALDRHYAPAHYHLGALYLNNNNEGKAVYFLRQAVRYSPKNAAYHFRLAQALYAKGKKSRETSYIASAKAELQLANKLDTGDNEDLSKDIKILLQSF